MAIAVRRPISTRLRVHDGSHRAITLTRKLAIVANHAIRPSTHFAMIPFVRAARPASHALHDLPLACGWSRAQLLSSVLPIRYDMRTVTSCVRFALLALIVCGLASPHGLSAQVMSARPASVGLTVVVPPRVPSDVGVVEGRVSSIRTTPTAIDLETTVGLLDRPVTRVELRLADAGTADSAGVWVRNQHGEFERLVSNANLVAFDAPPTLTRSRAPLRFRVESTPRRLAAPMLIPLEYRLTAGEGDRFSVWTFSSLLRVGTDTVTTPTGAVRQPSR